MKKLVLLTFAWCALNTSFGQEKKVNFQNKEYAYETNMHNLKNWSNQHLGIPFWLHLKQIPTEIENNELKELGIIFHGYIDGSTYLVSLSKPILQQVNIIDGYTELNAERRTEKRLYMDDINPESFVQKKVRLEVYGVSTNNHSDLFAFCEKNQIRPIQVNPENPHFFELDIQPDLVASLAEVPSLIWIEAWNGPGIKDDTEGRSLHRASALDTRMPNGRNYTGEGIGVLVRDDGIVGPHIDFQGRIDNSLATTVGQTHGDGVAGIMAGAGNLDPQKRGMAPGADVHVVNYVSSHQDAPTTSLISTGTVLITNSSYSDGCNGGYTGTTVNVDQQMVTYPNLLHVFSAGNSNGSNCNYGAGNQWGNITGGHKQGKNVIATANVFYDGSLVSSSSRGPAYDGRIKPDIAANGQNQLSTAENNTYQSFGGTSGAAPGIAGISAQLYQAYKEHNNGQLPENALIKATLLNTANEAGNVGPDFRFGWGIVNALRAARLIEDGRYQSGTITNGGVNNVTLNVPAGTKEVRFMLYWNDVPATAGATTALINDLDLVVTDPSSQAHLPWVLDPTPNATNLNTPATNGADHLNNMEQVLLTNPASGAYTLQISGFNVPMGPQKYYIVYEYIMDEVEVIYPNLGEPIVAGSTSTIHWDQNITGSALIEFSTNNGASWSTITNVTNGSTNYDWSVPSTTTGMAKVRVTVNGVSDFSDSTFSIAPLVSNLQLVQVCPDSIRFSWNALSGAENYDIYLLGNKYMEVEGTSQNTTLSLPVSNFNDPMYFAIRARNATMNWTTERTIAQYYGGGLLNCTLNNDLAVLQINSNESNFSTLCGTGDGIVSVKIGNQGLSNQSNIQVSYKIDAQAPVVVTYPNSLNAGQIVDYNFTQAIAGLASGPHTLICKIIPSSPDDNPLNDSLVFNFSIQTAGISSPNVDNFETNALDRWTIINPDGDITWEIKTATGPNGSASNKAFFVDHFSYSASGEDDELISQIYTLSSANPQLRFDLAKAQYNGTYTDELKVFISTDCGSTWTEIYYKFGPSLATVADQTGNWTPNNASNWRQEIINLNGYEGMNVQFRVVAYNGYGNGTYIDNFNVQESGVGLNELSEGSFSIYPNPANEHVQIVNHTQTDATISLFDVQGKEMKQLFLKANQSSLVSLTDFASGMYIFQIATTNGSKSYKIQKN